MRPGYQISSASVKFTQVLEGWIGGSGRFSTLSDRAPAYIPAAETFRPLDPVHGLVGAFLRLADCCGICGNVQYPAARGDDVAIRVRGCTGVKNQRPGNLGGLVEAADNRSLVVGTRLSVGRHCNRAC